MKYIRLTEFVLTWISASLLALLPIAVAVDFGGVLWWTQYAAAVVVILATVLAIPSAIFSQGGGMLRNNYVVLILLGWCCYAWLQTVSVFGGLANALSGGAKLAYRDWLKPFMGDEGAPTFYPVSIDAEQSAHSVAVLAIVVCIVWATSQVFLSRPKISMLLNVLAIGAALHAAFGIVRQIYPEVQVLGVDMKPNSFGTFVNRNNAALMMNLGLGSSLGLLTWRLAALTGLEVDDKNFEFNDLLSLTNDRDSLIGFFTAALCLCGLLVCGSRGGLVALVVGGLLALGWVRSRRGAATVPVVAAAVAICVAFLLVPLNLDLKSIQRFELLDSDNTTTMLTSGRLLHWQSSMQAAKAYFPAGSGLGSYAYAYLPYQTKGLEAWFHHADNLWLEVLVEQGLIGLLFVAGILFLWIRTLLRMTDSADPIDHGLRVSGWFILGSVTTSQFFDFGLIVPGMLFAVAVYVPATMARAAVAGLDSDESDHTIFTPKYSAYLKIGLVGTVLLFGSLALLRLYSDAKVEALVKHVEAELPKVDRDVDQLDQLQAELTGSSELDASPLLLDQLAKVQHARVRLMETAATRPDGVAEAQWAYDQTGIIPQRRKWYAARGGEGDSPTRTVEPKSEQVNRLYEAILETSKKSLRRLPLGLEGRTWQLYLDFIHQDPARSDQAIDQLAQIFKGNSAMLERLGTHAATAGNAEKATQLWRRSLERDSRRAVALLDQIRQSEGVNLLEVLPSNPDIFRRVARELIASGEADKELLRRADKEIACDLCESKREMAECKYLASEIAIGLEDSDKALEELRTAIELVPTKVRYHLTYIRRLRQADRNSDAIVAARRARILFPDDDRFDRQIREMASEALEGVEEMSKDSILLQDAATSP